MLSKKKLGTIGEDISCKYLEKIGYKIIERNFTCRQGEIDIIAKDKEEFVFIEVKTRRNYLYGQAKEAVNEPKQKHILKSTKYYLYIHKLDNAFIRFDVIEIYYIKNKIKLKHIKQVELRG